MATIATSVGTAVVDSTPVRPTPRPASIGSSVQRSSPGATFGATPPKKSQGLRRGFILYRSDALSSSSHAMGCALVALDARNRQQCENIGVGAAFFAKTLKQTALIDEQVRRASHSSSATSHGLNNCVAAVFETGPREGVAGRLPRASAYKPAQPRGPSRPPPGVCAAHRESRERRHF